MEIVVGNKKTNLYRDELIGLVKCYEKIVIDLGTGDGGFVYKQALKNPDNFYIGVDPSETQFSKFSRKAVRKRLPNVIFILGSIEIIPQELNNTADKVFVTLPWGTLLKNVVLPSRESCTRLGDLLRSEGELKIIFGYHQEFEPSETKRLELPPLSMDYIKNSVIPVFIDSGFKLVSLEQLTIKDLKRLETTWSKKLSYGKMREIYRLILHKK